MSLPSIKSAELRSSPSERAWRIARAFCGADETERFARFAQTRFADAGHGYDSFGMHPAWAAIAAGATQPMYRHWFRVEARGYEHIPSHGRALLVANHGGLLPFDAAMLWADVVQRTDPMRIPRAVADHFVPRLPWVNTLFARAGVVGGSRGNVHALLERDELLMVFPEGTRGIGKTRIERYRIHHWSVGHAEMAIRHRAPVIPVGIVGPEEQLRGVARLPVHVLGAPYLPVGPLLLPLPLPVRYHLRYGPPIALHERWKPAQADDPRVLAEAAELVRTAVVGLITQGLTERDGVFG